MVARASSSAGRTTKGLEKKKKKILIGRGGEGEMGERGWVQLSKRGKVGGRAGTGTVQASKRIFFKRERGEGKKDKGEKIIKNGDKKKR